MLGKGKSIDGNIKITPDFEYFTGVQVLVKDVEQ